MFALHKDVQMNMELSQGTWVKWCLLLIQFVFCPAGHFAKKSHSRGVAVEDLKLPAIMDFATGEIWVSLCAWVQLPSVECLG